MILFVYALAAAFLPMPPLRMEWFSDEPAAADAMEKYLNCNASGTFNARHDTSDVAVLAAHIVEGCSKEAGALRKSLSNVFQRKPDLLPAGKTADEAAAVAVNESNGQLSAIIIASRKHG